MSPRLFALAFCTGLLALAWVGYGFVGTSPLALAMTAIIAAVYGVGALELRKFRRATDTLRTALEELREPPAALPDWLERVPASLRDAVRSRVQDQRGALPGPALTPYLVGLLVMLGMLGTFLGMVVTFKGAVFALEGSTDLQAIRSALAEPIRGLGLSFGTSVAGVATSAMLGFMSAISRRDRVEAARLLESRIAGVLQPFSAARHRQDTVRALQAQADALPQVVQALHATLERIDARSAQLDAQLLDRQAQLQREVTAAYAELAQRVGASLQEHVAAGTRATSEAVRPVVEQAMAQVVRDCERLHQRLGEVAQAQVDALTERFGHAEQQRLQAWTDALAQRAQQVTDRAGAQSLAALEQVTRVLEESKRLVDARAASESRWLDEQRQRMDGLSELWRTEIGALRQEESRRGEAAVQRLSDLEGAVARHLASLGAALEAPITRLLHTASEVPQAAAGVIGQLREEMSRVAERDNLALQERTVLLERLGALVQSLEQAAGEQKAAVESMVGSATATLEQAHARFSAALVAQAGQATELASGVKGSADAMGAVADSFGDSVRQFQASHDRLTEALQRIEASLQRSTARSDEQLAYYVAQAREVIDLSIASQQGLVDSLRQLQGKPRPAQPLAESLA